MPRQFALGFTNKGDKPLTIKEVKASCGCMEVSYPKEPIAAGSRGEISVTYDAKLLGSFYKEVEVLTNASNDSAYLAQDVLRNQTDLVDVIGRRFSGRFIPSTADEAKRIDFIYLSPSLYDKVKDAIIITDSWTHPSYTGISNYWSPSDHRPILLDLDL